tara:strand:+ start:664 stop:1200 length:537 start_codon:yes stop_codon:yes gene_type:complete
MKTKVLKNVCSPTYLATMKTMAEDSPYWDFRWPKNTPNIEDRFPKLRLINHNPVPENGVLAGMAISLFALMDEKEGNNILADYDIVSCQISMKDKHRQDNFHTDYEGEDIIKVLGILDAYWDVNTMGGDFSHDNKLYPMNPGTFVVFDPRILHACKEITTDRKRFAIDYALRRIDNGT